MKLDVSELPNPVPPPIEIKLTCSIEEAVVITFLLNFVSEPGPFRHLSDNMLNQLKRIPRVCNLTNKLIDENPNIEIILPVGSLNVKEK